MRRINPVRSALAVGLVIAVYHLCWLILVATGVAKPFMDLVLRLHFIRFDFAMLPFDLGTAAGLLALTFGVGALFGLAFGLVWNWLGRREGEAS